LTARRKAIDEYILQSPFAIFMFIEYFINELSNQGAKTQPRTMATPDRLIAPTWITPTGDHVDINFDAAVARIGNCGVVAAICRSGDVHFMGASALDCLSILDPSTLESITCCETLALATGE
jgi:hypothetical protein